MPSKGQGRVYRRRYQHDGATRLTKTWWADYSVDGKRVRESTGCTLKRDALNYLADRLSERGRGVLRLDIQKTRYEDLEALIRADYRNNGRRSTRRLDTSLKHLSAYFGGWKAFRISGAAWSAYVANRLDDKAAPASVNRERSALLRMLVLSKKHGLLAEVPDLDRLTEDNVRDVDVSPAEFAKLLESLPPRLRPLAVFGYITGWRREELLSRTWADIDEDWLWLDRSTAKNRQPKAFPLGEVPWLDDTLAQHRTRKREIERRTGKVINSLFFFYEGKKAGEAIKTFRRSWKKACTDAALPGLRFHDLRRSAAVQMLEAGIPETHAMRFLGHKTRSIFSRYAISGRSVLRAQAGKLGERFASAPEPDHKVVGLENRR